MQIILISSRTLGASELLLLLSLFSLVFSPLFVFLLLLLLFLKSSPPHLYLLLLLSIAAIRLSPLSSPLVWSLDLRLVVLSSRRSRPGLTLCGCPIRRRVTGRFGRSGWVGVGDLGFWCHFLASESDMSCSQALSAKSGVLEKKWSSLTAGSGNVMDLMSCIWEILWKYTEKRQIN